MKLGFQRELTRKDYKMETSYETETKNTTANTWAGFWMMVFMAVLMVATWGEPDLIDALIYHLSDGYYK